MRAVVLLVVLAATAHAGPRSVAELLGAAGGVAQVGGDRMGAFSAGRLGLGFVNGPLRFVASWQPVMLAPHAPIRVMDVDRFALTARWTFWVSSLGEGRIQQWVEAGPGRQHVRWLTDREDLPGYWRNDVAAGFGISAVNRHGGHWEPELYARVVVAGGPDVIALFGFHLNVLW